MAAKGSGWLRWKVGNKRASDVCGHAAPLDTPMRVVESAEVGLSPHAEEPRDLSGELDRLHQILSNACVSVWSISNTYDQLLYLSPGSADLYGLESGQSINDIADWYRTVHEGDYGRFNAFLAEVKQSGQARIEHRINRCDGSCRWVLNRGRAFFDDSGKVARIDGFCQDVTDDRQSRAALAESRQRYDRIVAKVPGIVFQYQLDKSGTVSFPFLSPAIGSQLGLDPSKVATDPALLVARIEEPNRDRFLEAFAKSARSLGAVRWDGKLANSNGEDKWYQCEAQPELRDDGSIVWDGILMDITERKHAEIVAHEKLVSERANDAKSQFLSRMSHELRTPLNAILGFAQILQMTGAPEMQENVGYILKASRHLLSLVNEVLDISSIESGGIQLSLEATCLDALVEEVTSLMGPTACESGIVVEVRPSADEPLWVMADVRRLRQVLINLVSNAIKYNTAEGFVRVTCEPARPGRNRVVITDTGPGIPAEKRDRIFTAFDRLGAEESKKEGTGLGLALSMRLVEVMNGHLWMENATGGGCMFIVELDSAAEAPRMDTDSATVAAGTPEPGRTVLYIEDNPSNTRLMERIASLAGVRLITAIQGRLGFEDAREQQPDLVLLDLDLPDIEGMEVLSMLRRCEATQNIPVIVVSADANPGRERRAIDEGASGYVTKPFELAKITEVLTRDYDVPAAA